MYFFKAYTFHLLLLFLIYDLTFISAADWSFSDFVGKSCDPVDEFDCGNEECIGSLQRCDGEIDCVNGRDEEYCLKRNGCTRLQARCNNGQCLPKENVCDGYADCLDKTDESPEKCKLKREGCLREDEIRCRNQDSDMCIPRKFVCDGRQDCPDGFDEENCPNGSSIGSCKKDEYTCKSDGKCIRKELLCDDEEDCTDASDEEDCGNENTEAGDEKGDGLKSTRNDVANDSSDPYMLNSMWSKDWPLFMHKPSIEESVVHGESSFLVNSGISDDTNQSGHFLSGRMELFTLHRQAMNTLERMSYSIGVLAEALRALSHPVTKHDVMPPNHYFLGTPVPPVAYARLRKPTFIPHPFDNASTRPTKTRTPDIPLLKNYVPKR